MNVFLISIWALFALVSLCFAGLSFLEMALCAIGGGLCKALISLAFAIVFIAAFVSGANHYSELTRPKPKCCCAELFLAGVKNGVGVTLEAYTNTLHEAGIIMVPTGGMSNE